MESTMSISETKFKLLVTVPSKRRPFDTMKKGTLRWLQLTSVCDWKVFIEPQERIYYQQSLGKLKDHIVVMDKNDMGLGFYGAFSNKWALDHGYTHTFNIDDDSRGFVSPLTKDPVAIFHEIVADIAEFYRCNPSVGMVGFVTDVQGYTFAMLRKNIETGIKFGRQNRFVWSCYVCPADLVQFDEGISTTYDIFLNLCIRSKGYDIYTYLVAAFPHELFLNAGGLNDSMKRRFTEVVTREYTTMKRYFPHIELKVYTNNMIGKQIKSLIGVDPYHIDASYYYPK